MTVAGKLERHTRQALTAYEYASLTVQGFHRLQQYRTQITNFNNGAYFLENPGTMLLEHTCGFTMHADRPGAAVALREGPEVLLAAFGTAKSAGQLQRFFAQAFDRHRDPCLEGRVALLMEFLADLTISAPRSTCTESKGTVEFRVGSLLTAFREQCFSRFTELRGLSHAEAEAMWASKTSPDLADFAQLFNAAEFVKYLHSSGALAPRGDMPEGEAVEAVDGLVSLGTFPCMG